MLMMQWRDFRVVFLQETSECVVAAALNDGSSSLPRSLTFDDSIGLYKADFSGDHGPISVVRNYLSRSSSAKKFLIAERNHSSDTDIASLPFRCSYHIMVRQPPNLNKIVTFVCRATVAARYISGTVETVHITCVLVVGVDIRGNEEKDPQKRLQPLGDLTHLLIEQHCWLL